MYTARGGAATYTEAAQPGANTGKLHADEFLELPLGSVYRLLLSDAREGSATSESQASSEVDVDFFFAADAARFGTVCGCSRRARKRGGGTGSDFYVPANQSRDLIETLWSCGTGTLKRLDRRRGFPAR
jgi:hypothetical protein